MLSMTKRRSKLDNDCRWKFCLTEIRNIRILISLSLLLTTSNIIKSSHCYTIGKHGSYSVRNKLPTRFVINPILINLLSSSIRYPSRSFSRQKKISRLFHNVNNENENVDNEEDEKNQSESMSHGQQQFAFPGQHHDDNHSVVDQQSVVGLHVSPRNGVSKVMVSEEAISHQDSATILLDTSHEVAALIHNHDTTVALIELKQENEQLKRLVRNLQDENRMLHHEVSNKIVIEQFEGKGGSFYEIPIPTNTNNQSVEQELLWCDELENNGECPLEPTLSFGQALRDRSYWLVGLLLLQSFSGIILARNEILLENHPFIIYFLTMLVGAGGNAGNQASVRVIRGLALGTLNDKTQGQFLMRELKMACALSLILSFTGFIRALAFTTPFPETLAVTISLFIIVFTSVCLGAILPLILKKLHIDPAHSSTTIQVIMDILGVLLAVLVSSLLLESPFGRILISKLSGG